MNDLDALMTDIRHLIATWAARQVQAAVTPTPGERRGEPRRVVHFWTNDNAAGRYLLACGTPYTWAMYAAIEAGNVTCHSCMKTITYKTANVILSPELAGLSKKPADPQPIRDEWMGAEFERAVERAIKYLKRSRRIP